MLIGVHVLVAAHVAHWWISGTTLSPIEPSEAMAFSIRGAVNPGLIFFAAAILSTALFGRFFCGWGCHLVALQDACGWLLERIGIRPRPFRSRLLLLVPVVAFGYMFLWPIVYRLGKGGRLPVLHAEWTTDSFWATFPTWPVTLATFVFCGGAAVYFLGRKGFCAYGCPYGAAFGLADRLAPVRIRVTDACQGCGHCTAVCTSNVRVHEEVRTWGMVVDPGCMKCMDCVSVCPQNALYLGAGPPALGARPRRPVPPRRAPRSWFEELALAIVFAAAFGTLRGLYGRVPFLLSLGAAAILAYLVSRLWLLARRPNLRIRRWALKRHGRLLPAGVGFLLSMTAVGALWIHSAWIQWQSFRAGQQLTAISRDVTSATERRTAAESALRHLDVLERGSLLSDPRTPPRRARAALALGIAWAELGDLTEAEAAFLRGLESAPDSPELLYHQAMVEVSRGAVDRAVDGFEAALLRRPDYVAARENLAGVLCSMGKYREGLEQFEKALELGVGGRESRAETYVLMARAHLGLRDFASAETALRQALEQVPEQTEATALLAAMEIEP